MFGFCVVGDEKQKRDILDRFRSYWPNRRDESRYASKTGIIIPRFRKKCKPFFSLFLKKSCFSLIINKKKLQKSFAFSFVFNSFPLNRASFRTFPRFRICKKQKRMFCTEQRVPSSIRTWNGLETDRDQVHPPECTTELNPELMVKLATELKSSSSPSSNRACSARINGWTDSPGHFDADRELMIPGHAHRVVHGLQPRGGNPFQAGSSAFPAGNESTGPAELRRAARSYRI